MGKPRRFAGAAQVRHVAVSLAAGVGISLFLILVYVGLLARVSSGAFVEYCAFFLMWATVLTTSVTSAWMLRRRKIRSRWVVLPSVMVTAVLMLGVSLLVRLLPPAEAGSWLVGLLTGDARMSLVGSEGVPVLSARLVASEIWFVAVIEALLLIGAVFLITDLSLRRRRCSSCGCRCVRKSGVLERRPTDSKELRQRIARHDWAYLRELPPPDPTHDEWLRFDLTVCPSCGSSNLLSVILARKQQRDIVMIKHMALSRDDARTIQMIDQAA